MWIKPQLLLLHCYFVSCTFGYNILGVFPHQGKSHFDVFEPLMLKLSDIGYNVTVISYFPQKIPHARYTDVDLTGTSPGLLNVIDMDMLKDQTRFFKYFASVHLMSFSENTCSSLKSEQIQNFLRTNSKFDLIIVEMFATDCYLGLVRKFNAPFIGISSSIILPWNNDRFGNIDNPSYVPVIFMDFTDKMTFIERVENTVTLVLNKIIHSIFFDIPSNEIVQTSVRDSIPPVQDIAKNASLFLVNTHFSLNRPRPLVPNVVEVGGIHLQAHNPLPQNIEKFINDSTHGVIYFSMGSMIKAHTFPEEKRKAFLNAFSKLKQRVLWKWENDSMPDKPKNVMIQKWMPQFDILGHPNVVAFIAHGGLLGTIEAVHCGVPMMVMPQYGDQFTNAKALEAVGGGLILPLSEVTDDTVLTTLKTILEPSFNKQTKKLSAIFKDRPLSPMDTAIYWVEYVARHGGAPHMRTSAVDMPLYQYLLLDVIAFILLVLFTILSAVYYILRFFIRLIFQGKKEKIKSS